MTVTRGPASDAVAGVAVRHAEPRDAADLVDLASAVGSEEEGWLITDGEWRSAAEERRYLRAIKRSPHAAVLVAEIGERVVGRLSIARDAHPASRHVADVGLMVARDYRRRGAGRALMEAAEAWARSTGVSKIELHVFPHNAPAIALYERLGYEREGLRRRHYWRGGELVDAILMAKEL
jgi:RimJ/RimL family protein N-acetyltransferase